MKFFLSQDNDCHWYIIPANKRKNWEKFLEIDEDDETSWVIPEYAEVINCHPNNIEFENWKYK